MYKLFIALRYLRSNAVVFFSIVSVAAGIGLIIVVNSIMSGFSRDIRNRIRGIQAHLVVKKASSDIFISRYDSLVREIRSVDHVVGAAPRVQYVAWLGYIGRQADVQIVGIDPEQEAEASSVKKYFSQGEKKGFGFGYDDGRRPHRPGIVIGSELVKLFGGRRDVALGADPRLTTVRGTTLTPRVCQSGFEVVGTFKTGMNEYDKGLVFMELGEAQSFLKLSGPRQVPVISYIAVNIDDYEENVEAVRQQILGIIHAHQPCADPKLYHEELAACGLFVTRTWEEERRNLLQAVAIEKGIQFMLLFLIIVVAAINILTIYTLMVRSKTRDIGILRSLGATTEGISQVFLTSGFLCGVLGSVLGVVVGLKTAVSLNGIADRVESGSLDLAIWARENPESGWIGASFLLVSIVCLGLVTALVLGFMRRFQAMHSMKFGGLWVLLLSGIAFGLTRDAANFAPDGWSHSVVKLGSWLVLILPLAGLALFLRESTALLRRIRSASISLLAVLMLLALAGFAGREGFWENLIGHYVFNVLFGFGALYLAFDFLKRWRENPAPKWLNLLLILFVAGLGYPLASFITHPPGLRFRGFNLFPKDVYYLERIPTEISYLFILMIIVAAVFVSVLASVYPAVKASQYDPIEAIRRE